MAKRRLVDLARGGGCGCKIPPDTLRALLTPLGGAAAPDELLVGPQTRDDAAAWRIDGERALVFTADFFAPMVDDPHDFGHIAATNALSDVFAMGARPLLALSLLAMPSGEVPPEDVARIIAGGQDACRAAGTIIAGGHSIDSAEPLYGLAVAGVAKLDSLCTNAGARPGDAIVLGKPLGIGILCAAAKAQTLDAGGLETLLLHAKQANTAGAALAERGLASSMTDVTGFGLLGHLEEVCAASGCAAAVRMDAVPVIAAAEHLARAGTATGAAARNWRSVRESVGGGEILPEWELGLLTDPQTSGGLLVTCSPEQAGAAVSLLRESGFAAAAVIGNMEAGSPRIRIEARADDRHG